MLRMTKTATVTEIDQGLFSAVVSTYDVDRQGDQVARGAFARTIRDWGSAGRVIPLHWHHSSEPEDIIGHVDPASMKESRAGLTVQGEVDLETERGREAWRLLKANSVGFSFGYLATKTHERDDGIRILDEIDLFEVTVTPSPANNRTRVLDLKSEDRDDSEFRALKATWDRVHRQRDEEVRKERRLEQLVAEVEGRTKKEEAKARPVQVKTFSIE